MSTNKQALREAAEKATHGEWLLEYGEDSFDDGDAMIQCEVQGRIAVARIEGAHPESGFDADFQQEQQANAEFIAAANPATVLALLDELEAAERQNGYLREQRDEWERKAISNFEECSEMAARIEDLKSQWAMAFMDTNRWADKFRGAEQRIAELEARSVVLPSLKQTDSGERYVWSDGVYNFKQDVEEVLAAAGITAKGE